MKKLYLKPISGIFMVKRKSDSEYFLMLRVLDTTLNITRIIKTKLKESSTKSRIIKQGPAMTISEIIPQLESDVFISVRNSTEKFSIEYDIVSTAAIEDEDIMNAIYPYLYDDYKFTIISDKNWFRLEKTPDAIESFMTALQKTYL